MVLYYAFDKEGQVNLLFNRIWRAAKLESALYEEVEHDKLATGQALIVVILSSLAAGIGGSLHVGWDSLVWGTLAALITWMLWAFLTCFIGTKLMPESQTHADLGQLLRTIGFSSSPGLIRILAVIPGFGQFLFPAAAFWMLLAMIIAVRQALDFKSTLRAVVVCAFGWMVQLILLLIFFYFLGAFAPGR